MESLIIWVLVRKEKNCDLPYRRQIGENCPFPSSKQKHDGPNLTTRCIILKTYYRQLVQDKEARLNSTQRWVVVSTVVSGSDCVLEKQWWWCLSQLPKWTFLGCDLLGCPSWSQILFLLAGFLSRLIFSLPIILSATRNLSTKFLHDAKLLWFLFVWVSCLSAFP